MAKREGLKALNKLCATNDFNPIKFEILWSAIHKDFKIDRKPGGASPTRMLQDLFETDEVLATGYAREAINIGTNSRLLRRYWESVMFEEFRWLDTNSRYYIGEYSSFNEALQSQDELITEFLGRSPYERQEYLTANWLKNYRNFDILFWLVIHRANPEFYNKLDPRDYRRALFGIDRVESEAVNAWYNTNKYGSKYQS